MTYSIWKKAFQKSAPATVIQYALNTAPMNVALERANVPILGGTVFGTPAGKESIVSVNGQIYKDACAWMLVKNTSGKIRTYSENIYAVPENAKTHVATKVNLANKELVSLDNRPAADVYSNELGVSRSSIVDNVFKNPLGRIVGDVPTSFHSMM